MLTFTGPLLVSIVKSELFVDVTSITSTLPLLVSKSKSPATSTSDISIMLFVVFTSSFPANTEFETLTFPFEVTSVASPTTSTLIMSILAFDVSSERSSKSIFLT